MSKEILDLPMDPKRNDAEAKTVREYLKALLAMCWDEQEAFSGKRPFGNSGWSYDLYRPLVVAGLVKGKFDEYGDFEDVDDAAADKLIAQAIQSLS